MEPTAGQDLPEHPGAFNQSAAELPSLPPLHWGIAPAGEKAALGSSSTTLMLTAAHGALWCSSGGAFALNAEQQPTKPSGWSCMCRSCGG